MRYANDVSYRPGMFCASELAASHRKGGAGVSVCLGFSFQRNFVQVCTAVPKSSNPRKQRWADL